MYRLNDDIVALATLAGKSALNIVRISGPSSLKIYKKLTRSSVKPAPNYISLHSLYHPKKKNLIDQAMVVYYLGPKSFTGEDCLEITIHGGVIIVNQLLSACLEIGVRKASPGEFSYRAFINNKIDLLQAEAISSIISCTNDLDSYYSLNTIKGNLSQSIQKSFDIIKKTVTIGEHELDFNEGEIDFTKKSTYLMELKKSANIIKKVIEQSYTIEEDKSTLKIVITGLPNVGKSSLFNVLIGKSKAIVTDIKGTTRDILEQAVYIKDHLVLLVDTAGLRKAKDNIEKIGVEKSLEEIKNSDIVLIVDDKNPNIIYNKIKNQLKNKPYLLIYNKVDINTAFSNDNSILISCKKKTGFTNLLTSLSTLINNRIDVFSKQHSSLINRRQKILLENIDFQLSRAVNDFDANKDLVVCLSLLYDVLDSFNTLIRPINKDEILNDIFGGFCVGK